MLDLYYLNLYILAPTAAFLGIILTFVRIADYVFPPRKVVNQGSSPSNIKVLQLRRRASGTTSWNVLKIVSIVLSVVMLVLTLLLIGLLAYTVVGGGLQFRLDPLSTFILLVTIGLPIYLLVSTVRDDRRLRRGIRSRVAEQAELEVFGEDQSMVVEQCRRVLFAIGARVTHVDAEEGTIVAEVKRNRVSIEITKLRDTHYKVLIVSDAIWPSARFDFGENKRIVDNLIRML